MAWHGKVHKQTYKLSGAQYATSLHIDETPRDLFSSLPFKLLNNIKCYKTWQGVKQMKTTHLGKFK